MGHQALEPSYYLAEKGFKLDGIGPVDNRPYSNKLHQFVWKNLQKYTWHMTHDMWKVTLDMWHVVGGEQYLKDKSLPLLLILRGAEHDKIGLGLGNTRNISDCPIVGQLFLQMV